MKRWISYGAACVAGIAVVVGALSSHHPTAQPQKPAWVAQLTKDANARASANTQQMIANEGSQQVTSSAQHQDDKRAGHSVNQKPDNGTAQSKRQVVLPSALNATQTQHKSPASTKGTTTSHGAINLSHVASGSSKATHPSSASQPSATSNVVSKAGAHRSSGSVSVSNGASSSNATTGTTTSSGNSIGNSDNITGSATPPQPTGDFTIIVSEDQGQQQIALKHVDIEAGVSLMDYMHRLFQVETTDGDAFMVSINGIRSQWTGVPVSQRQPVDWFFYVNGQTAPVGAASIYPKSGDVDVWDYHRWDQSTGKG